ncbi:DUF4369 domain-containing protein [Mediterranea massiliensis]|uniref:DUF4369 domain-containing protein n=1 Tax=Mediterranea massiliensis TaxID=1841865 RepID=UPI0025A45DA8|nr:DUF4369 domain-containing protein [Mediterranea massiliensis]MDM8337559.1 DUF4369 domain-containing protein [Mediterranea massiliensis]
MVIVKNVGRILPLLLLLFAFSSCSRKYKIEGSSSVTSLDGKMLYLKIFDDDKLVTVDSAEVVHGLFSMKGKIDSVMVVTLYMGNEGLMPLVLEDGKVKVTISNTQLVAEGTPLNDALYDFIDRRNKLEVQLDELERKEARMVLDGANIDDVHEQLAKENETLNQEASDCVKQFIMDNYETVLGPSVFMMMCSTLPYPVMTPVIEDIMRTAPASFKSNKFVQDYLSKAKENMQLMKENQRLQDNVASAH